MKQYRVINFPEHRDIGFEEKKINDMSLNGYRLVSVSEGRAYFESYHDLKQDEQGFLRQVKK